MIGQPETKKQASAWLTQRALHLLRPLMGVINPEQAKLNLEGRASDHDARADRLESFARPFHLYALLLGHLGDEMPEENASWQTQLSQCLANGANRSHPAYWGPSTNFHQHVVEMGLLVLSLEICRKQFWDALDPAARKITLDWLETARSVAMHWNNHMFFGIFILEFLKKEGRGRSGDQALIDGWFRELESMYRAEGWFRDGLNDSADYYNAYAFHYYGLNWSLFFGDDQHQRHQFWADRASLFLDSIQFAFASNGGVPNFGRSQTYRFATLAPFGPAIQLGCCPIPDSQVRRLAEDHLDFFLKKEIYTPEGWLNIGWTDENTAIAETYSCVSSTYWAAKGFSLLLLPLDHPFWETETADTNETYIDGERHANSVGLSFRRFDGDTELINTGSAISGMNLRFFAAKWSKFTYRASAGVVLPHKDNLHPLDLALVANFGSVRMGRHITNPIEFGEHFARCAYTLGDKNHDDMVAVETLIAWRGPWIYIEHIVDSTADCVLRQGGFALGYPASSVPTESRLGEQSLKLSTDGNVSMLQPLTGFQSTEIDGDQIGSGRRHTLYPHHTIPVAVAPIEGGQSRIDCLIYFGPPGDRAAPWSAQTNGDTLLLRHPHYDEWNPHNA
ncbi:DUF2264 domain-containing protein [Cerasicoccus arenae]|uniref:DUF2264 domain-containing protein n=2 Tax=Cerasicoccus arenae TaxID=424488 RepID=A0A8J3DB45_9BACT|nr:DUF2264 domain-containing protein [Cerasicoccus arenae]GHB97830.1 hypothetical protein GCM10007047_12170 [Cerasicoccus arenae]